jgi:hypothetical protein
MPRPPIETHEKVAKTGSLTTITIEETSRETATIEPDPQRFVENRRQVAFRAGSGAGSVAVAVAVARGSGSPLDWAPPELSRPRTARMPLFRLDPGDVTGSPTLRLRNATATATATVSERIRRR